MPNLHTQCSKKSSAVSSAVIVVWQGINRTNLENLSTIVKTASNPRVLLGNYMIKSIVTCSKGRDGFSNGSNKPTGH